MLLFPSPYIVPAPGGGLIGHDQPQVIINSTAVGPVYTGNITGVEVGDLMIVALGGWVGATEDPALWTVTIDGLAPTMKRFAFNSSLSFGGALYSAVAANAGSIPLSVTIPESGRALAATGWRLRGGAGATLIGTGASPNGMTSDVTSFSQPPTGLITSADGNAVLSAMMTKDGNIGAQIGISGVDGGTAGQTGTNATNDVSHAHGYSFHPTAGASVTHVYNWTTSIRGWCFHAEVGVL